MKEKQLKDVKIHHVCVHAIVQGNREGKHRISLFVSGRKKEIKNKILVEE